MKTNLLQRFGFLGSHPSENDLSMVVYLLDRIIVADLKMTDPERIAFEHISAKLASVLDYPAEKFSRMLARHSSLIEQNKLSDALLVRLTRDALNHVSARIPAESRRCVFEGALELALSDAYLHKRELMLLYDLAHACLEDMEGIRTSFSTLYHNCKNRFEPEHPVIKGLEEILDVAHAPVARARMELLQKPDELRPHLAPPLVMTYSEWADWITTISLIRAHQHRNALMNHTRVSYSSAGLTIIKGLIKWISLSGPDDIQIDEAHDFCHQWCTAVRENRGKVPFPEGQLFSVVVFGSNGDSFSDCCSPRPDRRGQWYITCRRHAQYIEVHAFDILDEGPVTYWCPENAETLSAVTGIDLRMLDGHYPADLKMRHQVLREARELFA